MMDASGRVVAFAIYKVAGVAVILGCAKDANVTRSRIPSLVAIEDRYRWPQAPKHLKKRRKAHHCDVH